MIFVSCDFLKESCYKPFTVFGLIIWELSEGALRKRTWVAKDHKKVKILGRDNSSLADKGLSN